MPSPKPDLRYFFVLRDGEGGASILPEESLQDDHCAVCIGITVAKELMRNREIATRHWRLEIRSDAGDLVQEIRFSEIDETVQHLTPDLQASLRTLCDKKLEIQEVMYDARMTLQEARILVARSRMRPTLVAFDRERTRLRANGPS